MSSSEAQAKVKHLPLKSNFHTVRWRIFSGVQLDEQGHGYILTLFVNLLINSPKI